MVKPRKCEITLVEGRFEIKYQDGIVYAKDDQELLDILGGSDYIALVAALKLFQDSSDA
jgi:hypothetical protein